MAAQIWRYDPRKDSWKKVFTAPQVKGIDGYDVPLAWGLRGMAVYQGLSDSEPALYIPATAPSQRPEAVLFRTRDGEHYEIVSEPGLGLTNPTPRSIRGIRPFKDWLFIAPAMGAERGQTCTFGSAVILVSKDPDSGKWEMANPPNFGNPNNVAVFTMAAVKDSVYAGTTNIQDGFELWKTDAEGSPPFVWEKILTKGAYRGKYNQIGGVVGLIGDDIFVGTGIQSGGHDRKNKIGPAAPEIIRVAPDGSWDLIVGEARQTPDGLKVPLSGMGPGFNRLSNGYIWYGQLHEDCMYVGTFDWGAFTFFAKVNEMSKQIATGIEAYQKYLRRNGGFSLWRTADGVNWTPVTRNGFGKYMDLGIRTMCSTPYGLFIGVLNSFGPQRAVRRSGGWTFEHNPECGCQIYLGSYDHVPGVKGTMPWELRNGSADSLVLERTDDPEQVVEQEIRRFYGETDFRHVGFWREDIQDARTACENLMAEVVSFFPHKEGNVLDVCCGRGASTRFLAERFGADSVTGLTLSKDDVASCKKNSPGTRFVHAGFPRNKLADGSFDFIVCLDSLYLLRERSAALRAIHRLLRPGGRFVFTDLLVKGPETGKIRRLWKRENLSLRDPIDYEQVLSETGFMDIQVIDMTATSWIPYNRNLHRSLQSRILTQRIDEEQARAVIAALPGGKGVSARYLLAAAAKQG